MSAITSNDLASLVETLVETLEESPLVLMVVALAVLVCLVCMCRRCRGGNDKKKPTATAESIAKEHKKIDKPKYQMATSSSMKLLKELDIGMNQDRVLPSLGSRRRKVWFQLVSSENYQTYLLSMAEVPARYSYDNVSFRDRMMKEFSVLRRLSHPHLQPLHTLSLCSKKGAVLAGGAIHKDVTGNPPVLEVTAESVTPPVTEQQVARVELFHERGSLKDYIHNVSPTLERGEKYGGAGDSLSPAKMARLGHQILQAVLYLYDNAPASMIPLGHIRIENIYMEKKNLCKLGGYENSFLGYGCWLQQQIVKAEHASSVDVIMFGHVMYYMCTGDDMKTNRLVVVLPEEEHFLAVADERCREMLRYIFKMKRNKIKHSMKEISNHSFFTGEDIEASSDSEEEGKRFKARFAKLKQKTKAWFSNDGDEAASGSPKNKNKNKTKLFTRKQSKPKEE